MATTGERRVSHARSARDVARVNVAEPERVVSVLAGAALAAYALQRRDLRGIPLALLGAELIRRGASGHCMLYGALGVSTADGHTSAQPRAPGELVSDAATVDARKSIKIEQSVTILRPRPELFRIWRDLERLPAYIDDLVSVTVLDDAHSHWVAALPGGKRIEWNSEIVNEIPNELLAWKTIGDTDVAHAGSVHFRDVPGSRGTEVRVVIDYEPPGGRAGALAAGVARLIRQAPESRIEDDLRRFKARLETGDVAAADGQTTRR